MKKLLVVVAAALVSFAANAQFYAGGMVGLDIYSANDDTTVSFNIAPELGYNVSEDLSVGLALGYGTSKNLDAFAVTPYVRYYFCDLGNARLFGDAYYSWQQIKVAGYKNDSSNIGVEAGIAYPLTNTVSLVTKFSGANYDLSNEIFDLDILNTFSVGAFISF